MARKWRGRGHYCWVCDRVLANERFSGRGHAKHVCKVCQRLGREELEFRQIVRNLQELMNDEGIVPRGRRKQLATFLEHADVRIRTAARLMAALDVKVRAWMQYEQGLRDRAAERPAKPPYSPPDVDEAWENIMEVVEGPLAEEAIDNSQKAPAKDGGKPIPRHLGEIPF